MFTWAAKDDFLSFKNLQILFLILLWNEPQRICSLESLFGRLFKLDFFRSLFRDIFIALKSSTSLSSVSTFSIIENQKRIHKKV